MGLRLDLVMSFIIVGILTTLVFGVNSFVLQNSVDTRLYNDMQTFADVSTEILQEELKTAVDILQPLNAVLPDTILRYVAFNGDTVKVWHEGRNLLVRRSTTPPDTIRYALHLSSIQFDLQPDTVANPHYLKVRLQTESLPNQHVRFQSDTTTVGAFSEVRYYLRNVHLRNN